MRMQKAVENRVSEYWKNTWHSNKDSLDLVVGLSLDSLVAGRLLSARRLSRARRRHLLGNWSSFRPPTLHLGLTARAIAFLHRKEKRSPDRKNHSLLLWRSLRDE